MSAAAEVCDAETGVCAPASKPIVDKSSTASASVATAEGASKSKRIVKVDIVSDTICPWCYIGKKRFEKAVAKLDSNAVEVQVNWLPFFLDPTLPTQSRDKMAHYKKKFGEARTAQMIPHMKEIGKGEGINFSYGGKVGNTLNSHRLIEWSKKFGKQDAVVNVLFEDYFEKEQDIADVAVLVRAAEKAGLNKDEAKQFLNSTELVDQIKHEVGEAYEKDISGVPHFTIDGRFQLSGGQETAVFLNAFKRLGVA